MKNKALTTVGMGLFLLLALIIMVFKPIAGTLNDVGQMMLGIILITLGIWIFKPLRLSYSAGGFFLAFSALALGLKPAVVFAGFTQSAMWSLIPALFFGYVLQKTGLGKRIALGIIKLFKPSYISLVMAWVIIGVVLSILTPSITVRVAIVIPIAIQCCELCKLEKGSKGNSLIILTALAMALLPGTGWLSGSLWGPIIQGMINAVPGTEGLITTDTWSSVVFLPMEIVTVLLVLGSLLVLKPKEKLSRDAIQSIKEQKTEKMSRTEIITAIILVAVFLLFITNKLHKLPDAAVCLAATFALFLSGVLEPKDMNVGVSWDLIVFIAMALSLSAIFTETGISEWLAQIIVPAIAPIAGSPWIFMFSIVIFMFAWRFIDVAIFIPTMAIMAPVLPAINEAYGINPLVWLAIFVMAGNCFFMSYQNMWAVMGQSIAKDRSWKEGHLGVYGLLYFAACMIALFVAIPMWIKAGLL